MEFTGYAGNADAHDRRQLPDAEPPVLPVVHGLRDRGHAASPAPTRAVTGSTTQNPGPPSSCDIYWVTGDHINGPMYTQDQFLVSPTTRPPSAVGTQDAIASQVPTSGSDDICAGSNCHSTTVTDPSPMSRLRWRCRPTTPTSPRTPPSTASCSPGRQRSPSPTRLPLAITARQHPVTLRRRINQPGHDADHLRPERLGLQQHLRSHQRLLSVIRRSAARRAYYGPVRRHLHLGDLQRAADRSPRPTTSSSPATS